MKRLLISLSLAGLLAGCAELPTAVTSAPEREAAFKTHKEAVARLAGQWIMNGRISFQSEREGLHAGLKWAQGPQDYDVSFSGPAGQGAAVMQSRGGVVILRSQGQTWVSDRPEHMFLDHFGWHLPIGALRWWMVGLPAPGAAKAERLDAAGRLELLVQEEWTVEFLDYRQIGGVDLPGKVFLSNPIAKVRVVIDKFEFLPAEPAAPAS